MGDRSKHVKRGSNGRFLGYRVNCESVPCLPARVVSDYLCDPRRIPYLLVWIGRRDGKIKEAARLGALVVPPASFPIAGWIELKRWDGVEFGIRFLERSMPRSGGRVVLLACAYCQKPRRALYGWEANKDSPGVGFADWSCRSCSQLSYASEGSALVVRTRCIALRPLSGRFSSPRPGTWNPCVFSSPSHAIARGFAYSRR